MAASRDAPHHLALPPSIVPSRKPPHNPSRLAMAVPCRSAWWNHENPTSNDALPLSGLPDNKNQFPPGRPVPQNQSLLPQLPTFHTTETPHSFVCSCLDSSTKSRP